MKEASKWVKKAFPKGPSPMKHSEETEFNITYIIGEVESNHQEHMPSYHHYATNHNWCIHCSGTHTSEDHHLSLGIPIVSNPGDTNVSPHQETKATSNTNPNASNNYKTKGQLLLFQQSAFLHAQWTPPQPLTPHITSQPSMQGSHLWRSTSNSQISSTTSRISNSMLPPPSHQVRSPPTTTNEMQSSQSSKKSTSTSRRSNISSTSSTRTMRKSLDSMKSWRAPMLRTGEHSHGDHSQTGNSTHQSNNPRSTHHHSHHHQMRNDPSSQTATGSTWAHGKPVKSSKRVHLSASNFFNNESRDIEDTYGDSTDDVYNNIN